MKIAVVIYSIHVYTMILVSGHMYYYYYVVGHQQATKSRAPDPRTPAKAATYVPPIYTSLALTLSHIASRILDLTFDRLITVMFLRPFSRKWTFQTVLDCKRLAPSSSCCPQSIPVTWLKASGQYQHEYLQERPLSTASILQKGEAQTRTVWEHFPDLL